MKKRDDPLEYCILTINSMSLPSSDTPNLSRKFLLLSLVLIVFVGVFSYANSLRGQFLWDDESLVQYNPYVKNWSHLPKIFTSRLGSTAKASGVFYRPVQTLTYLVDYSFWRLNVFGYHLVNMIWHILAAISIFGLIQVLFRRGKLALLTALLFVAHPMHTEAVSYISGRADSLATFFMIASYILYLKQDQKRSGMLLSLMVISYVLALLSKEISIVLLPLIWLYHYSFKKSFNVKAFAVLIGTTIVFVLWRTLVIGTDSMAQGVVPTFFERLPGVFIAFVNYFGILFFPFNLHMEHGGILFPFSDPRVMIGAMLLTALCVYTSRKREKDPFLYFSVGWFLIALFPSSNFLFTINAYMAEHWLYIPSIGFFLIVSRFLINLYENQKFRGLAVVAMIGLLVFYSSLTIRQNRYWNNGISFYKKMLQYAPTSSRLYNNLAKAYHDAGKNDELIALLRSAIQLQPDNALAHNNLGNAYKEIKKFEEAKRSYQRAIKIDPEHAGPYYNLSTIYADVEGDNKKAVVLLNKAIKLSPHFPKPYHKLALIYLDRGENRKSIVLLNKALKLNPDDPQVYHIFGYAYMQMSSPKKAEAMYKKALEVDPNYVQPYNDLAIIYLSAKKYGLAIKYCDLSVALGYRNEALLQALKPYR